MAPCRLFTVPHAPIAPTAAPTTDVTLSDLKIPVAATENHRQRSGQLDTQSTSRPETRHKPAAEDDPSLPNLAGAYYTQFQAIPGPVTRSEASSGARLPGKPQEPLTTTRHQEAKHIRDGPVDNDLQVGGRDERVAERPAGTQTTALWPPAGLVSLRATLMLPAISNV